MTARETYEQALQSAPSADSSLSVAQITSICPHLNHEEIRSIFECGTRSPGYVFATPPLRVDGAFQLFMASSAYIRADGIRRPALLGWIGAATLTGVYYQFATQAIDYARRKWGDLLIQNDWKDTVTIELKDPKARVGELLGQPGYPTHKMSIHFTVSRPWKRIIKDQSAPLSQVIDRCMGHIDHSPFVGEELRSSRYAFHQSNCSRCGSGLGRTRCFGCRVSFLDDGCFHGWDASLPPRVVDYLLRIGNSFETNPKIAWATEHDYWKAMQGM